MAKLSTQLLKHGVQFAVGMELVNLSKRMEENKIIMDEERKKVQETPPIKEPYRYIFYEKGVDQVIEVTDALLEAIIANGIEVDETIMFKAKELIEMMNWVKEAARKESEDNE